jgi:hypothetical protein
VPTSFQWKWIFPRNDHSVVVKDLDGMFFDLEDDSDDMDKVIFFYLTAIRAKLKTITSLCEHRNTGSISWMLERPPSRPLPSRQHRQHRRRLVPSRGHAQANLHNAGGRLRPQLTHSAHQLTPLNTYSACPLPSTHPTPTVFTPLPHIPSCPCFSSFPPELGTSMVGEG